MHLIHRTARATASHSPAEGCMPQYRIAWLPGDGVGREVMDATRLVLDAVHVDAAYQPGDIGWEFWRREGDAFPART
ncbi:MAG: hypothetical protein ACXVH0_00590, partial [Thermoanaerobaculia bacterium]